MALLANSEVDALKAGEFSLDFTSMELMCHNEAVDRSYSGAGMVRHTDHGWLELTLYDQDHQLTPHDVLPGPSAPGEWVPQDEFFRLSGRDWRARRWAAEWIRPDTSGSINQPGVIVRGRLRELTHEEETDREGCSLWLYCHGLQDIPTNEATTAVK